MNLKKTLLGAIVASSLGAVVLPAQAEIVLNFAPPASRYENVPPPRRGYVWESGHWQWNGRRHEWVAGHWERARRGYAYHGPRWEERDGRWYYYGPNWSRNNLGELRPTDQDNNIIQRGGIPGDRDGDGAPDHVDTEPDNRNRG